MFPNSSNEPSDQQPYEYVRRVKGKSWPFGREIQFCPQKNPKNIENDEQLFGYADFGLWRVLDADEMTPGQLLGYP